MKKKLLGTILVFVIILTAIISLNACGGDPPQAKKHNVSVTLKLENYTDDYDYITSVNYRLGEGGGSGYFTNGTLTISDNEVKENSASSVILTYKDGYDLNSVTVTEKEGKNFTKRAGTGDDANKLYIEFTSNSDINYEFSLSVPKPVFKYVNLDLAVDGIVNIVEATSHPVYNFLKNAQVYALSGNNQTEQWGNIATVDGGELSQPLMPNLKIKTDMSQKNAYFYVRFDKSNPRKLVYKTQALNNLFTIKNASYENVTISTLNQNVVNKKPLFDEEKRAYRFEFDIDNLNSANLKIALSNNLNGLNSALVYEEYDVKMNPVKFTLNKDVNESLQFSRVNPSVKKTYDAAETFQFYIGSDACNRDLLKLQNFQFEIGGKPVVSSIEDSTVTITLNANESPFEYPGENTDAFYIDLKKSSVEFDETLVVNTVKTSKELEYFGVIDTVDGEYVISKEQINQWYYEQGINMVEIPINNTLLYNSFKLKVKLNNGDYIEKSFVSGEHFNIAGFNDEYDGFIQNTDSVNQLALFKTNVAPKIIWSSNSDDENTTIGDFNDSSNGQRDYYKTNTFIAYAIRDAKLVVLFNLPIKENLGVECFISDIVYRNIDVSFVVDDSIKEFEVKKDGVAVSEKDADNSNVYNLTDDVKLGTYKYQFVDSRNDSLDENSYIEYYYEIKLYSNGKVFYTAEYQLNGDYKENTKSIAADISANWDMESYYPIKSAWEQEISFGNDGSMYSYNETLVSKDTFGEYNIKVWAEVFIDKIEITIKAQIKQYEQV